MAKPAALVRGETSGAFASGDDRLPRDGGRQQMRDEVAAYLRELVMSGRLAPGTKLSIEAFAQRLHVSATPVREAFLLLSEAGWLRHEPFRGFFVEKRLRADVVDAYGIHASLGGELAARCALRRTDQELAELERLDSAMREAAERRDPAAEHFGHAFHNAVYAAARSARLAMHADLAREVVPRRFWAGIAGWFEMERAGHGSIIEAIRAGDAERARHDMSRHIEHARDLLLAHLDSLNFWSDQ